MMKSASQHRFAFFFAALATALVINSAHAQAPAAPPAALTAPATPAVTAQVPEAATKAAPVLPAGSTAAPGWNVPPKWSEVEMKGQYASVPGREANVLIEDSGHNWRAMRNGPVTFYGGVILFVIPVILLLFYFTKGPFRLREKPTGRLIERFNSAERTIHWTMAFSFVALALTGLMILFGKYLLMPVIGASAFAVMTNIGKYIHNFVGPLFLFSIVAFFFMYVKDNFLGGRDFEWLGKFGGLLSGNHVPSGRFNGGEKVWFWLSIVIFGLAVSISGVLLLFPNWNTSRELMAQSNLIHAALGTLFVALSLGHIYIGTIGTEGALKGMREGYVDEAWAKEHHALWLEEVKSGKRSGKSANAAQVLAGDD
jgi:formate dehydrogenase subunit gamma